MFQTKETAIKEHFGPNMVRLKAFLGTGHSFVELFQ